MAWMPTFAQNAAAALVNELVVTTVTATRAAMPGVSAYGVGVRPARRTALGLPVGSHALGWMPKSVSRPRIRVSIRSRIGRTASTPCPAGSSSVQSR